MKNILYTFLVGVLIFLYKPANATHLSGGELFYSDLGNNRYLITLRIYRDCFCTQCAPFSPTEYLNIYNANGVLLNQVGAYFPGSQTLHDTTTCLNNYPTCVEVAEYYEVVDLSQYSDSVLKVVYQRCCRPHSNNLLQDQGSTFEVIINRNLAPEYIEGFNQKPPYIACVNKYYNKSFAGDFKGDSVVYKFAQPFYGANYNCPDPSPNSALGQGCPTEPDSFSTVNYMQGFSVLNPTNNPADTGVLRIDPQTGIISGTPNQVGNFVIGVEAEQYRGGNFLGSVKKDFMLYVLGPLPSSVHEKAVLQNSLKVYQSDGNLVIENRDKLNRIISLDVFNVNGECCFKRIISNDGERQTFDVSHFAEGIYFYRIRNEDGEQAIGKFVK